MCTREEVGTPARPKGYWRHPDCTGGVSTLRSLETTQVRYGILHHWYWNKENAFLNLKIKVVQAK